MKKRKSLVIFYDNDLNIFVQIREEQIYGLFGGGIEKGETAEQALKREIKEELLYDLKEYTFWKKFTFQGEIGTKWEQHIYEMNIFLSLITPELLKCTDHEEKGAKLMNLNSEKVCKQFNQGDREILKQFKMWFKKNA